MEIRANCMEYCPFIQDKLVKREDYQAFGEQHAADRDNFVIKRMETVETYEGPESDSGLTAYLEIASHVENMINTLSRVSDSRIATEQTAIDEALAACSQIGPNVTQKLGDYIITCASKAVAVQVWRPAPKDD